MSYLQVLVVLSCLFSLCYGAATSVSFVCNSCERHSSASVLANNDYSNCPYADLGPSATQLETNPTYNVNDHKCMVCQIDCFVLLPVVGDYSVCDSCVKRYYNYGCMYQQECMAIDQATPDEIAYAVDMCRRNLQGQTCTCPQAKISPQLKTIRELDQDMKAKVKEANRMTNGWNAYTKTNAYDKVKTDAPAVLEAVAEAKSLCRKIRVLKNGQPKNNAGGTNLKLTTLCGFGVSTFSASRWNLGFGLNANNKKNRIGAIYVRSFRSNGKVVQSSQQAVIRFRELLRIILDRQSNWKGILDYDEQKRIVDDAVKAAEVSTTAYVTALGSYAAPLFRETASTEAVEARQQMQEANQLADKTRPLLDNTIKIEGRSTTSEVLEAIELVKRLNSVSAKSRNDAVALLEDGSKNTDDSRIRSLRAFLASLKEIVLSSEDQNQRAQATKIIESMLPVNLNPYNKVLMADVEKPTKQELNTAKKNLEKVRAELKTFLDEVDAQRPKKNALFKGLLVDRFKNKDMKVLLQANLDEIVDIFEAIDSSRFFKLRSKAEGNTAVRLLKAITANAAQFIDNANQINSINTNRLTAELYLVRKHQDYANFVAAITKKNLPEPADNMKFEKDVKSNDRTVAQNKINNCDANVEEQFKRFCCLHKASVEERMTCYKTKDMMYRLFNVLEKQKA